MTTRMILLTILAILFFGRFQSSEAQRPSGFEQRRGLSPEKLVVRVDRVERIRVGKEPVDWYLAHASVTRVVASKKGLTRGAKITFLTYFVPEENRRTYAGPLPPKLHAGWKGDVYLKHVDPDNEYDGRHAKLIMWSFGKKYDNSKGTRLQPQPRR